MSKATHHIAPAIRKSFLEALEQIKREEDLTFSQILAKWIKSDDYANVGAVLTAISKFDVREAHIKHDHTLHTDGTVSETISFIEKVIGEGPGEPFESDGQNGSLLLTEIPAETTGPGAPVAVRQMQGSTT